VVGPSDLRFCLGGTTRLYHIAFPRSAGWYARLYGGTRAADLGECDFVRLEKWYDNQRPDLRNAPVRRCGRTNTGSGHMASPRAFFSSFHSVWWASIARWTDPWPAPSSLASPAML
jgi:hypothetical protein